MRTRAIILAISIFILSTSLAAADPVPVNEATLTGASMVYEINRDVAGRVYVTDWGAGQVWRVSPAGAYTRFYGLGAANISDARPDSANNIWFTDYNNPNLARINTATNPSSMTTWNVSTGDPSPHAYNLGGLAIDDGGKVWFSELGEAAGQLLYRFNPANNELCGYTLPGDNHSFYVLPHKGVLWLGDWVQGRIVRFDPNTLLVTYWDDSKAVTEPRGLTVDAADNIWWADKGSKKLGRLEPGGANANRFTTYSLPLNTSPDNATPYMVAVRDGKIWYTAEGTEVSYVGTLDPSQATGTSPKPTRTPGTATATQPWPCRTITPLPNSAVSTTTGALSWLDVVWSDLTPSGATGWLVYEVAWGGIPYAILAESNRVWVTDQLFQQLVRITLGVAAPHVVIARSGTSDVQLSWESVTGAGEYRVWYGSQPYLDPGGAGQVVTSPWKHSGVLNLLDNYYYVVRSVAGTDVSLDSNRTGKFTFALVPGSQ